jgi:dipeptidyl aminopeptidase/acylaminoacyl peptidase
MRAFKAILITIAASAGVCAADSPKPPITSKALASLRDIDGLNVSPDGRWVVFLMRQGHPATNAYQQVWHVIPTTGGPARRIADAGTPIQPAELGRINGFMMNPAPVWSRDSAWIAYLRKDNGRTQIWRARVDGHVSEQQLTHGDSDARALAFSADRKTILFETEPGADEIAAALAREGRQGFRYDNRFFPTYSRTPTMPTDVDFEAWADGKGSTKEEEARRRIYAVDLARYHTRTAIDAEVTEFAALTKACEPKGREHYRGNCARSRSGALVWTEALDPKRQGGMAPLTLVAQVVGGPEPAVCAVAECTSQVFKGVWWRNESELLFARGEGVLYQDTALYAWRVGEASVRRVLTTPNLFASTFEWNCAVALDRLICFYEEPARPRRLVAINLADARVETLYDPNPAFADFDLGPPPQRLAFRSPTGVESYGYLVLPPERGHPARASNVGATLTPGDRSGPEASAANNEKRLSLVVVTYRCSGFLRGGIGDEYPIFAFAAAGHAVLCFNTPDIDYDRAARMSWNAYMNWSRGPGDPEKKDVQEGLEMAIAELDRFGIIDPARIGVTGLSFGAETTSYALWHMPRLAAAAASGVGFEPADTFLYGPAPRELMKAWGLGDPASARWNDLSVSRNPTKVRAPYLLNVPDREMLSALQPVTALEDAGRAVEMYVFPDEYHIKWQPAHRLAIYNRNIDWMNFWLQGREDPDPAKAEQYKRWRAMRVKQCELFGLNGSERGRDEEPPWYCRQ